MAINLADRPDLERRAEDLADRLGLKGRGRTAAIIKRALAALEDSVEHDDQKQLTIKASIDRYIDASCRLRARLAKDFPGTSEPLSASLQRTLYDQRGLPERS